MSLRSSGLRIFEFVTARKMARFRCGQNRAQWSDRKRGHGAGRDGGEPPTGAWDFLRFDMDLLLEARQLPVAGRVGEGVAGLAGERDHRVVRTQRIAEHMRGAE